jgi:hypothetical protein
MASEFAKMKVTAYKDPEYLEPIPDGVFVFLVNPENYTSSYVIEYAEDQAPGTSAQAPKFDRIAPQEQEYRLLLDKTGAIPGTFEADTAAGILSERAEGIQPELDRMKDIMLGYKGELHQPAYLEFLWGTLLFKGVLLEMRVNIKLFLPNGTPLRAEVDLKCREVVPQELRVRKENDQSADISQYVEIRQGDKLPLLCQQIYREPENYIKVAEANKMVHFRSLNAGASVFFPSVRKNGNE